MMQKFNEVNYSMLLDLFHRGRKEGKVDLKYSNEFLLLYLINHQKSRSQKAPF